MHLAMSASERILQTRFHRTRTGTHLSRLTCASPFELCPHVWVYKQPLLGRHEPVVSGPHFDEGFGRLGMTLLVRMKPYRKDPEPSANCLFRMS